MVSVTGVSDAVTGVSDAAAGVSDAAAGVSVAAGGSVAASVLLSGTVIRTTLALGLFLDNNESF